MNVFHLLIMEYVNFIKVFDYKYILIPIIVIISALIVVMYLAYIIHSFIHELGHLTFGIISGCKLLSYRIGNYAFVKENNKICVKIHKVKGSGGQCLLGEPKRNSLVSQYCIILGGIFFNLIISVLFYIISFHVPIVMKAICYLLCFVGIIFIVMNGLPLNNLSIINDGKCLMLIINDKEARTCYYSHSIICRLLFESKSYGDIPKEYFDYDENAAIDNELIGYMIIMKYYHYLENKEYKMANWSLRQFEPFEDRLKRELLIDLYYEKLYIELLTLKREAVIKNILSSHIMKNEFCKKSNDINKLRVKMAYELIYEKNSLKGMQYYSKAKFLLIKHLAAGEVKFQDTMISRILK